MKKIISISLFFLILTILLTAQSNYDRIIPSYEYKVEGVFSPVLEWGDTSFAFVACQYAYKYGYSGSVARLGKSGEVYSNIDFPDSINPYVIRDWKKDTDGIYVCGQRFFYDSIGFSHFYAKLSPTMDTLWTKTIRTAYNFPGLVSICRLRNGNLVMVGSDNYNENLVGGTFVDKNNAVLLLADNKGNVLNLLNLPKKEPKSLEGFHYVMETQSGELYALGGVINGTVYNEGLIMKFDSTGKLIWRKNYSEYQHAFGFSYMDELADGTLLVIGGKEKLFFLDGAYSTHIIVHLDKNGNVLEEKTVFNNYRGGVFSCIKSRDGNYVCAGSILKTRDLYGDSYIIKFSPRGDSIWLREYSHWEDRHEYFFNIAQASDGGYFLSGETFISEENHSSKGWVVKTDSMGCALPGCYTAIEVEPEEKGLRFLLSPNPTGDYMQLYLNNPEDRYRRYEIELLDQTGRRIHQTQFSGLRTTIDLSSYPSGLLYYRILHEHHLLQSGSVVKF
jgi:hypothetical protein